MRFPLVLTVAQGFLLLSSVGLHSPPPPFWSLFSVRLPALHIGLLSREPDLRHEVCKWCIPSADAFLDCVHAGMLAWLHLPFSGHHLLFQNIVAMATNPLSSRVLEERPLEPAGWIFLFESFLSTALVHVRF